MRDPFSWSFPLGRVFGITVRVHLLFPLVFVGLVLRAAFQKDVVPGSWIDMAMILGLMFLSVLLHEFGHCFGARMVEGDANEVLLWPLGGLANCDVPHTPRANFVTALCGPLVNLAFCLITGVVLTLLLDLPLRSLLNPFAPPYRFNEAGAIAVSPWGGGEAITVTSWWVIVLARLFWVNWVLFLFNMVLVGFPMDAGRLFQSVLWKYVGYRQATMAAVFAGFLTAIVVGVAGIVLQEVLALCLALFIYVSCRNQWVLLETDGAESVFGYDFSQGYTSLERDQSQHVTPRRRRQSWWQRWWQRRQARKLQMETEQRAAEERRMDDLLAKVARVGLSGLTEEEQRFMKRVSDRYKNRQ